LHNIIEMIERQNILDLIGKNKNKYSSCIITSYTFDFMFFEERIMSILRTSNIKNINVFLDGKYLDKYHEDLDNNGFKTHKTYSINKIYEKGVFHPKIMLLTGPKQGLLIIGSGNLTTSGLSTNDEIWGAFHLNSIDSPNATLFAAVWNYLQQYFIQTKGFNTQKLSWITQRSPWLNDIKGLLNDSFISINKEVEVKFISNKKNISSYQEIIENLPPKTINKLTIISPYFDENGKILEQLKTDLKITKTVCITDSEFGLLPLNLNSQLDKSIDFYDWKDIFDIRLFDKRFNRLHAKIFHFEFDDGLEYIFIGSANATINALGSKIIKPVNAEAGILLRRKTQKNYLQELGINIKRVSPINIKSFIKKKKNIIGESVSSIKYKIKIIYSEINGNKLSIYCIAELAKIVELIVLDSSNLVIEKLSLVNLNKEATTTLKLPKGAYKIYLSEDGIRISNYSLIHNVALQSKCNPDPNYAEIGQIIEALSNDPENGQFIELLSYADYNWVDEELGKPTKPESKSGRVKNKPEITKDYGKLTEEEFNKLKSIQSNEFDILNNPSVQIADFLNILSRGLIVPKSRISENNEEALSKQGTDNQIGEGEEIAQTISYNVEGEHEEKITRNHLDKVTAFYSSQLVSLHKSKSFITVPKRPLTIKDLSNISIALDLMCIYYGKKYIVNKSEFTLNLDEISFADKLSKFVFANSIKDTIIFFKKHHIILKDLAMVVINKNNIEEFVNKEKIISYIKSNSKNILKEFIGKKEYKFSIERLDKINSNYKNWVYYKINTILFSKMKEELALIDSGLLIEQNEYSLITTYENYLPHGIYNSEQGYGLKYYLIEMLGSFLINANSIAGFKEYDYEILNEKIFALRKSIFEHASFLCLNIYWKEDENKYRDILLLDLLHFVYPNPKTLQGIGLIKIVLKEASDKAKYKSQNFNQDLDYFINSLLPKYIESKDLFNTDSNNPVRVVRSTLLNDLIYTKEIGFCSYLYGGKDFIIIEKPGFEFDFHLDSNALKIGYPESQIKILK
jgi:hypothetical protein